MPHSSTGTRGFLLPNILLKMPMGSPTTSVPSAGGVGENGIFQLIENSPAETPYRTTDNLCLPIAVVHTNDNALVAGYAVSSTTLIIVEVY